MTWPKTTRSGKMAHSRSVSGRPASGARRAGLVAARLFGVTSPNTITASGAAIVIRTRHPTACSGNWRPICTLSITLIAKNATLTAMLPNKTVIRRRRGLSMRRAASRRKGLRDRRNRRSWSRERLNSAVSEPEKKAEAPSRQAMPTRCRGNSARTLSMAAPPGRRCRMDVGGRPNPADLIRHLRRSPSLYQFYRAAAATQGAKKMFHIPWVAGVPTRHPAWPPFARQVDKVYPTPA